MSQATVEEAKSRFATLEESEKLGRFELKFEDILGALAVGGASRSDVQQMYKRHILVANKSVKGGHFVYSVEHTQRGYVAWRAKSIALRNLAWSEVMHDMSKQMRLNGETFFTEHAGQLVIAHLFANFGNL